MGARTPLVIDNDDATVIDFFTEDLTGTDAQQKTEALASALREDSEAYVSIYKSSGNNMPEQYCTRFPADKFDWGQIQQLISDEYGAGDYRIRMYSKGKLRGNKLISIANKINVDKKMVSHTGETHTILSTVLERMEANNNRMLQMMQSVTQPQNRMDMLQEMLLFKQLFSNDKPSGGLGQITEALELLQNLGVSVGQKEEKESGFGDMLMQLAPVITQTLSAPKPTQTMQHPVNNQSHSGNNVMLQIKMGLIPLLKAASKNADQMTYAEFLFDQLDEKVIREYIILPDAIDRLIAIEPKVAQYREWFKLLIEHVKAQLGLESEVSGLYDALDNDISDGDINTQLSRDDDSIHTT